MAGEASIDSLFEASILNSCHASVRWFRQTRSVLIEKNIFPISSATAPATIKTSSSISLEEPISRAMTYLIGDQIAPIAKPLLHALMLRGEKLGLECEISQRISKGNGVYFVHYWDYSPTAQAGYEERDVWVSQWTKDKGQLLEQALDQLEARERGIRAR